MSTRKILLNSFGGFHEVGIFDEERPNDLLIRTYQDCEGILEEASVLADEPPGKDFRHVAKIPMNVIDKSMREGWLNDKEAWKRWANDADNRKFRTWKGNL